VRSRKPKLKRRTRTSYKPEQRKWEARERSCRSSLMYVISTAAYRFIRQNNSHLISTIQIYRQYEEKLREHGSLDFDDLLVYGLKLFRKSPGILSDCKHILVDEFQDTNTTQYELMKLFSKAHGCVTVVGDPDQSIYGWRSASECLEKPL
jgi:superfamily I DNA/RNA helicase